MHHQVLLQYLQNRSKSLINLSCMKSNVLFGLENENEGVDLR